MTVFTLAEVAAQVGVAESTLRREIRTGRVEHLRVGPARHSIRFTEAQVDALIASWTTGGAPATPEPLRARRRSPSTAEPLRARRRTQPAA